MASESFEPRFEPLAFEQSFTEEQELRKNKLSRRRDYIPGVFVVRAQR